MSNKIYISDMASTPEEAPSLSMEENVQKIEDMLDMAQSASHTKLSEALTILLEDAKKWHTEFKEERLDSKDANAELVFLHHLASDLFAAGEDMCSGEDVKAYLTDEDIYPVTTDLRAGNGLLR